MGSLVAALGLGLLSVATPGVASGAELTAPVTSQRPADMVRVIVSAQPGLAGTLDDLVRDNGGTTIRPLPIIDGVVADVPGSAIPSLRLSPVVRSVNEDGTVYPRGSDNAAVGVAAAADTGELRNVAKIMGADKMWAQGVTGKGVDVAVIDTGVAPVAGLNAAGKIIDGPDLSFDSGNAELRYKDSYGHGTHMAGIIAGSDLPIGSNYATQPGFVGIAPESRVVNVKVGATDGAADVSQVIAAIDWVVQHRTDNGLNIRVLNLSFGTDSRQPAQVDPLSYAAEVAWRKGIVVVVAAGNDGRQTDRLSMPAANPVVLAVAASDPMRTIATGDDYVATFSDYGDLNRHPDVLTPGVSIVSLRVPGSWIDTEIGTGIVGDRFQRGSGSSQSAAVASGAAALLLQKYPGASPDDIKMFLTGKAVPVQKTSSGSGTGNDVTYRQVQLQPASHLDSLAKAPVAKSYATGTGSIALSRGSSAVTSNGVPLTGEKDIFGKAWNPAVWTKDSAAGTAWTAGTWNGSRWSGSTWMGSRWSAVTWAGTDWAGLAWSDAAWSGSRWSGSRWSGSRWSGSRWSGAQWSGSRWSSAGWT